MTPDATTPPLDCPRCGASATPDANYCMTCGQPLRAASDARRLATVRIVDADASDELALTSQPGPESRSTALTPRVVRLAVAAWRQPVVRSLGATGAGALALSLAWRVAGAALSGARARRALLAELADGELAPMVGDLLRESAPSKRLRRRGKRGEVIEEMIYMRRIFRR